MGDQQFCLRWNNHQNTLISVFDSLLEGEILVDCTLAAEGKFLRAHKVVLSACSPFFSDLLRQHYEKHPILIMKDVKFDQLKAMLDYMYRGEVNISQDQLGTFLKAAESLQIKGLSDSAPNHDSQSKQKATDIKTPRLPSTDDDAISAGSSNLSPIPRKKKRRHPSVSNEDKVNEESQSEQLLDTSSPTSVKVSVNSRLTIPPSPPLGHRDDNSVQENEGTRQVTNRTQAPPNTTVFSESESSNQQSLVDSVLCEPKSEFIELDDEEDMTHDEDAAEAGPSHKSDLGGYSWHMERPEDTFLSQEPHGGQRSAQDTWFPSLPSLQEEVTPPLYGPYSCPRCARKYAVLYTLERHLRYECGVDKQFACPVCQRRFSRRDVLRTHQKNSKHYSENEENPKTFLDMIALSTVHRKS